MSAIPSNPRRLSSLSPRIASSIEAICVAALVTVSAIPASSIRYNRRPVSFSASINFANRLSLSYIAPTDVLSIVAICVSHGLGSLIHDVSTRLVIPCAAVPKPVTVSNNERFRRAIYTLVFKRSANVIFASIRFLIELCASSKALC